MALLEGRLASIGAREYRGVVFMRGRVGKKDLTRLLGVTELPYVISKEMLALRNS